MIANLIDHTDLKSYSSERDISKLCEECIEYGFRSICINPSWISHAKYYASNHKKNIPISTVIGFPLGNTFIETKIEEIKQSIYMGADELDIVLNIGQIKSGKFFYVEKELEKIMEVVKSNIVVSKIIIETPVLTHEEKMTIIKLVDDSGADFIKTCTGFNGVCDPEDIKLISQNVKNVKIKASGGIKTLESFDLLTSLGANVIGTSKSVDIMKEWKDSQQASKS